LQPVEETHSEQIILELTPLGNESRDSTFDQSTNGEAIERHCSRPGASVGRIDIDRVV
jgi:hypothetical protein